ncbi:VOC family protein [Streptomyces sp. NPDC047841]|uniref:VOC family protein n=1 Tax=Streptomyces sp. NPDC047841 TaxID=3154708 RepID=UPI0034526976
MRAGTAAVAAEGSEPLSEFRLELVVLPVSDVDRAKAFYQAVGFRLDEDHSSDESYRVVHMTPPGSPCSILFGTEVTTAVPGTVRGLHLVVTDIESACLHLRERGVETSEVFHDTCDMFHRCTDETRRSGLHPQRLRYRSYATFNDPDGNEWVLQEVPA